MKIMAWRDENASVKEHKRIMIWCGALCLWALVLLAFLFTWWLQLDDVLKVSELHIG